MKKIISLVVTFVLGMVISGLYFDTLMTEQVAKERSRTQEVMLNLGYEMVAHELDVGLLKKENHTLRQECAP